MNANASRAHASARLRHDSRVHGSTYQPDPRPVCSACSASYRVVPGATLDLCRGCASAVPGVDGDPGR